MIKAFKYRIYPNRSQEILFSKTFGCVRLIWNANVASFNSYDKEDNPKPSIIQKSDLIEDRPWLSEVSAAAIQQKVADFKETVKQYFSKSDGIVIDNPKYLRENQSKISRIQKYMSRKTKGSNRWHKNRLKIARLHNKVSNRRLWFLHNLTTYLVNNYDTICIEDLNVSGMVKNHKLASSISDASFSLFRTLLEYKCEWYGKTLSVIDRFYPSSKTCSNCGWKKDDLSLSDRTFACGNCGIKIDRDLNAAINIKRMGVDILYNRTSRDEVTSPGEAFKIK